MHLKKLSIYMQLSLQVKVVQSQIFPEVSCQTSDKASGLNVIMCPIFEIKTFQDIVPVKGPTHSKPSNN